MYELSWGFFEFPINELQMKEENKNSVQLLLVFLVWYYY